MASLQGLSLLKENSALTNNGIGFGRVAIRSLSWNATLVVDGLSPGYDFGRGTMATCELHPQDRLMTLDPNCNT